MIDWKRLDRAVRGVAMARGVSVWYIKNMLSGTAGDFLQTTYRDKIVEMYHDLGVTQR